MKSHLLTLSLALGLLAPATAATVPFPSAPEAKAKANAENKPILLLWHGSDWMEESSELCKAWKELASKGNLPVILAQFDEKTGLTDEERKAAGMPVEEYDLPVALLLAPDGSFMARYRGKTVLSADAMQKAVKKSLAKMDAFTTNLKQARESQGLDSVRAAGKALEQMAVRDAVKQRELTKLISDRDPNDETGYRSMFCLEHMGMYKIINDILKGGPEGKLGGAERDFAAAEKRVRDILGRHGGSQPKLATEQHQQWLAGLYYIQKERMVSTKSTDRKDVLATLDAIVKLDPKSEYGKGAKTYYDYWNPDSYFVVEDFFYEPRHQVHGFEKDWHVDVTEKVKGPGTYVFRLVPEFDGSMVTRNYRLMVNGKEVARPAIDEKQSTKQVEFTVPDVPKGAKVEVWLTTQCHDHWFSCHGHIEMEKK